MDTLILWIGGSLFALLAALTLHTVYANRRRTQEAQHALIITTHGNRPDTS